MISLLLALACASEPTTPAPEAAAPPVAGAPDAAPQPDGAPPTDGTGAAEPGPGFPPESPEGQALAKAQAAGKQMAGALKAEVKAAIEAGGPPNAIQVCNTTAPQVAAMVAAEQGVSIGRSSLKLRNPDNAGPEWVQRWLQNHSEIPAEGPSTDTFVDEVDGQRVARAITPIPVEAVCLACHGPAESLAPEVQQMLAEKYPSDQATGYALGDLRGALWVEAPVTGANPEPVQPPPDAPPAPQPG